MTRVIYPLRLIRDNYGLDYGIMKNVSRTVVCSSAIKAAI